MVDARPPERLVARGRQGGALPQQEAGQERGGGLGQPRRDHLYRPALHRHPPGRRVRGERGEPLRARVPDEQDALAAEMGRVVEAARIAIADRGMHASVHDHPLPLSQRRPQLAVERELHAPGGGQALRPQVCRLHVEEKPHAIRRQAHRLLAESALEREGSLAPEARHVVVREGRRRRPQHAERRDRGQDESQRQPRASPGGGERGDQQHGPDRQQHGRAKREPRRGRDADREGGGGRQQRRGGERPISHAP